MQTIKKIIKKIPFANALISTIRKPAKFNGSADYWDSRYKHGGTSGPGSFSRLAEFKAEIINDFVKENNIHSVMEFGCGDGNQLTLANYPAFIGLDVSPKALELSMKKFDDDKTKSFFLYSTLSFRDNYNLFKADLTLSLDVIYHLVENEIFENYMNHLFNAASKFVIIYSSNFDKEFTFYETDRNFTSWIEKNIAGWKLLKKVDNRYKHDDNDPDNTSRADFYIYGRV